MCKYLSEQNLNAYKFKLWSLKGKIKTRFDRIRYRQHFNHLVFYKYDIGKGMPQSVSCLWLISSIIGNSVSAFLRATWKNALLIKSRYAIYVNKRAANTKKTTSEQNKIHIDVCKLSKTTLKTKLWNCKTSSKLTRVQASDNIQLYMKRKYSAINRIQWYYNRTNKEKKIVDTTNEIYPW